MSLALADLKASGTDFGRIEDGTYPARVVQVVDFGLLRQIIRQVSPVRVRNVR